MTTTLKLYEIADRYRTVMDRVALADGELDAELEAELDSVAVSLEEKVVGICSVIREHEAEEREIKEEIDRLATRRSAVGNRRERLRTYLQEQLGRAGLDRVKTPLFSVWVQDSPPAAKFVGESESIPAEFRRVRVEFDAIAALAAHKAGASLPETVLITQRRHLRIK